MSITISDHFIRHIEIRNYKLFQDFKAEGFGRVNLIGGKNNVGKTAFMEALFLSEANDLSDFYSKFLETITHRNAINRALSVSDKKNDITELINRSIAISIYSNKSFVQVLFNKNYEYEILTGGQQYKLEFSKLTDILDMNFQQVKTFYTTDFIAQDMSPDWLINYIIGKAKLDDKYETLNKYLGDIFGIKNIDTINNFPYLKKEKKYEPLSEFGQGIKSFIEIATALLFASKKVIFIDEIENGIHYTNFDKLWEIILTISREQNVQVFATTHSKECIESYARVAKKLEDDEIAFIEMGINKYDKPRAIVMNSGRFYDELEIGNEVRGW